MSFKTPNRNNNDVPVHPDPQNPAITGAAGSTASSLRHNAAPRTDSAGVQYSGGPAKQSAPRRWLRVLAAPLILAGLTIYGVSIYLDKRASHPGDSDKTGLIERIVAASEIAAHTSLGLEHLALRAVPLDWVGPDSFGPDDLEQLLEMRLKEPVPAGMPLTRAMLLGTGGLLEQLEEGRRAVTLPIDRISSASGLLHAGDRIDLYVTFEHRGRRITSLLVSSVRVLDIDRNSRNKDFHEGENITLDVSPQQAAKLIAAQQDGTLTAVLMADRQPQSTSSPVADHLAGYAGVDASFEQSSMPDIIYGDAQSYGSALQH